MNILHYNDITTKYSFYFETIDNFGIFGIQIFLHINDTYGHTHYSIHRKIIDNQIVWDDTFDCDIHENVRDYMGKCLKMKAFL